MKAKLIVYIIILTALVSVAYATELEINLSEPNTYDGAFSSSIIQIDQLKYEPYPVNPGEYFTLWIKAENVGKEYTKDAIFELVPKYPFSLDSNEDPVRKYGQLGDEPVVLKYKVRVDKNAVEGANELEIKYSTEGDTSTWISKKFDIMVDNVQTDFDMVIQEVSGSEVSIAIANTGKKVAYSVIVKIPEQDYFEPVGTSGQMVGNLEDGDYTLVGFEIAQKDRKTNGEKPLKVEIDYTDEIGERRAVIKELSFDTGTSFNATSAAARTNGFRTAQQASIYQQWYFWAIIVAALYIIWKGYKWIKKKRDNIKDRKIKK
jgi:hypothetical protein